MSDATATALEILLRAARETATARRIGGDAETALPPRITFHFTPTSASWMDQIETWFAILTLRAIKLGSFGRVKDLMAMIDASTCSWKEGVSPFVWAKTADAILAQAVLRPTATSESRH